MKEYLYMNKSYYRYDDLKQANHPCLKGTRRGIISFFKKKDMIEIHDYLYAKYVEEKGWRRTKEADYANRRDKVFLAKEWVDSFKVSSSAPEILKLTEAEMFRDDDGYTYEVEVRGERHHKRCFFRARDVAKCFDLDNLIDVLTQNKSAYVEGDDYVRFSIAFPVNYRKGNGTEIFLTYHGLMRAMMVSRAGNAKRFLDWAMETLFAAHLGTDKQKAKVVSMLTGIDYPTVKAFCGITTTKLSVIYLLRLGKVNDLRQTLNIPDTYSDKATAYKYGRTNDVRRRFSEHLSNGYAHEDGFDTTLEAIWFVDNERSVQAEAELKHFLDLHDYRLDNDTHTEIAIFDTKSKDVIALLDPLFSQYAYEIKTLNQSILSLEEQIQLMTKDHQTQLTILTSDHDKVKTSLEHAIALLEEKIAHLREVVSYKDTIIKLSN